jgi:hypothetical protein
MLNQKLFYDTTPLTPILIAHHATDSLSPPNHPLYKIKHVRLKPSNSADYG